MNPTPIPWADFTWNPITGCTRGCEYCYAQGIARRFQKFTGHKPRDNGYAHLAQPGETFPAAFSPTIYPHRLDEPLRRKKSARIFMCSMGDLFDPAFPDEFRDRVFEVVHQRPEHTFLLLTKRADEMYRYFTEQFPFIPREGLTRGRMVPVNLWLGVTVTNQSDADERIPLLLKTPAAHRFVCLEPLLGPVKLADPPDEIGGSWLDIPGLHPAWGGIEWVIVGGKTPGPPLHEQQNCDWCPVRPPCAGSYCRTHRPSDALRSLRDQCAGAGVPFFYKHGKDVPLLDGVRHDAIPEAMR